MASSEFNRSQYRTFRNIELFSGALAVAATALAVDQSLFNGEHLGPAGLDAEVRNDPELFFGVVGSTVWMALWLAVAADTHRRDYQSRL